jgi:7tm Chemosensory receptor
MKTSRYTSEFSLFSTIFRAFGLYPHASNRTLNLFLSGYTISILNGIVALFVYGLFIDSVLGASDSLSAMVETLVFIGVIFTSLINIMQAWLTRAEQLQIYEKFDEIDDHIQDQVHHLIDHAVAKRQIYRKYALILLLLLIIQSVFYAYNVNLNSIRYWLTLTFPVVTLRLRCLQILFYLDSIDLKLQLLCDMLRILVVQNQSDDYLKKRDKMLSFKQINEYYDYGPKKMSKVSVFDQLVIMKQIYGKIWDISNLINDCFGWSLLVLIAQNFIEFTCNGYWLFVAAFDQKLPTAIIFGNNVFIKFYLSLQFSFSYSQHLLHCANHISSITDCIFV